MNVGQVKQLTLEWLCTHLDEYPGLCAAHFVGSINTMPEGADFPLYKDVDLHLVFEEDSRVLGNGGPFPNLLETEYHGLILEGGYKPACDYSSAEAVLRNPEIAHHLTVDSILYDPYDLLCGLQRLIRNEYTCRQWVQARVEYERRGLESWQGIWENSRGRDPSGSAETMLLGYRLTYIAALLCVATLQSPSSSYSRLQEILSDCGRLDLYHEAINTLGFSQIQAGQIERLLQEGAEAFDLAVQVKRTPAPFQHKLNAHQRSYFVDKCRSLIAEGQTEHAAGWLTAFYLASTNVILTDGPEEVKPVFAARRDRFMHMLGMDTSQARSERYERMIQLDEEFFRLAGELIRNNPRIF